MRFVLYFLWIILATIIVIGIWIVLDMLWATAYGQNVSVVAPAPVTPTPTIVPTPTSPTPNPQYLPQKAYVQLFAPENGIPSSSGSLPVLQPVIPTTAAAPEPQQNVLDQFGGMTGILAAAGAVGVYLKTRLQGNTIKENSAMIAKGADVDQSLAKQVYENMPDKGNNINDKPEIRLETLNKNKEEATETAANA